MSLSQKIFFFFQGQWWLDRSIEGHGKMKGVASFLPLQNDSLTLLYREEGEHIISERKETFSFVKEYMYCLNQNDLDVYFSSQGKKGGFFHRLLLPGRATDFSARGIHLCGKDLYKATYEFLDPHTFTLQYDVQGPKKDLKIHTLFKRQDLIYSTFF